MGILYQLTSPSGKRYIGVTVQRMAKRWGRHRYDARRGSNLPIHRAIRKYGPDRFTISILAVVENEHLKDTEIRAIATLRPEYNVTAGGDGALGVVQSDVTRQRKRDALTGRVFSRASREKMSISAKARCKDPDNRAAMAEASRRLAADPVERAKRSVRATELWKNTDYRIKQAEARKSPKKG